MVTVAFWNRRTGRPRALSEWNRAHRRRAESIAHAALRGVGIVAEWHVQPVNITLAFRRPLTPAEALALPPHPNQGIVIA
ncbi:MAG: hypothetical protein MI806_25895 [Minwuiales bacterium]|nr:hypothetical protein [Minwuiales bacterium]